MPGDLFFGHSGNVLETHWELSKNGGTHWECIENSMGNELGTH
jgi:hypothetical protein